MSLNEIVTILFWGITSVHRFLLILTILTTVVASPVESVRALQKPDSFARIQELRTSETGKSDQIGRCVLLDGGVAVVAGQGEDEVPVVDVFRTDGSVWVFEQRLVSEGGQRDGFGDALAMHGDRLVIGAPREVNGAGSAYVYRRDGKDWVLEQKLIAIDRAKGDQFGGSVAVGADVIMIGAVGHAEHGESSGAVYVYRFDGSRWGESQVLHASDGQSGDLFGQVSLGSGIAAIAAFADDEDTGSVYVFRFEGDQWIEEQKLVASDGEPEDLFGWSAAVGQDVIVIGSPHDFDDDKYLGAARVYRFTGSTWEEEQKLMASDAIPGEFGDSVALNGDTIAVGSPFHDLQGAVYLYRYTDGTWVEVAKLVAKRRVRAAEFGQSLSMSADVLAIGSWNESWGSGAVVLHALTHPKEASAEETH